MHAAVAAGKAGRVVAAVVAVLTMVVALAAAPVDARPAGRGNAPSDRGGGKDPNQPGEPPRGTRAGGGDYVTGELLVRFDPSVSEGERERVRRKHGLQKVRDLPLAGLELTKQRGRGTPPERARQVGNERSVRFAEPNFKWYASAVPNDPEFVEYWGLHNTGQYSGSVADADIDAPEAWDIAANTSAIVVAVIDTGTQITHPDLAPNIWVNAGEIAGNGKDDDKNGYIDDVNGWDFYWDNASVFDEADADDHGTHVSGTIAAVENNSTGGAGVSQAKIMPLKFLGPNGGSTDDAILALDYAIKNGAHVTNNSWGGGGYSEALLAKIQEAADANLLFVAAAGNSGANMESSPQYPAAYDLPSIVSVASTTNADGLSSFSNYGSTTVDLGAPGSSIASTLPLVKSVFSTYGSGKSAFHTFGLEGVTNTGAHDDLLAAALGWAGVTSSQPILVVDDDEGALFGTEYTAALATAGFTNVTPTTVEASTGASCRRGPTSLSSYKAVVWFTGADDDCTLTSDDQSTLTSYVNGGGVLLLFGIDIGYDLQEYDSLGRVVANTLRDDVLKFGYIVDADADYSLAGITGTPYAGISLTLQSGTTPPGQYWSSGVHARSGAFAAMKAPAPTSWFSGTSMAAPHVAGAVAHLRAKFPTMKPKDIKSRLMSTGDYLTALDGKTVSGRRLNLANALATGTLTGTVTPSAGGSGIAGVCVLAVSPSGAYQQSTTTNGSGVYSIVLPTGTYSLLFRDCTAPVEYGNVWSGGGSDWSTASTSTLAAGETKTVNAAMPAVGSISGVVRIAGTATGLSGICVSGFTTSDTWVADAVTDSTGSFQMSGFGTGSYEVRYRDCTRSGASQYATHWYNALGGSADHTGATTVSVFAGLTTSGVDAALPLSGAISGVVKSAASGNPALKNICVSAYTTGGYFIQRVRTDVAGAYTVRAMGTGSFKLRFDDCSGLGYATEWYEDKGDLTTANLVSVTAGSTTTVNTAFLS